MIYARKCSFKNASNNLPIQHHAVVTCSGHTPIRSSISPKHQNLICVRLGSAWGLASPKYCLAASRGILCNILKANLRSICFCRTCPLALARPFPRNAGMSLNNYPPYECIRDFVSCSRTRHILDLDFQNLTPNLVIGRHASDFFLHAPTPLGWWHNACIFWTLWLGKKSSNQDRCTSVSNAGNFLNVAAMTVLRLQRGRARHLYPRTTGQSLQAPSYRQQRNFVEGRATRHLSGERYVK